MTNILEAIYNIIHQTEHTVSTDENTLSNNRVTTVGIGFENYIKDAFANTFEIADKEVRNEIHSHLFSWLGNQKNPPDCMIKGGDAIEMKKIETENYTDLPLNSSYPHSKIKITNTKLANACRMCEEWTEKDMIYCIGNIKNKILYKLWMVYGNIYAADEEIYERIKNTISDGIHTIPEVEFSETAELGRVNKVDPLGITNLRIRGMWNIQHPKKVFNYIYPEIENNTFEFVAIIPKEKYYSFNPESITRIESITIKGFSIEDKKVKNPNNPAQLIEVKLIKYIVT